MLQRHPLSAAFPSMPAFDQDALTDDIQQHGQLEPITIFEGMVLDGWHRYQSCCMLEIEPTIRELPTNINPVTFVLSCNIHRRHLTGSQRAAAVVACSEWASSGTNQNTIRTGEPGSPVAATVTEMAKQAEVSERTIQQAKRAAEAGLCEKVRDGELTAKQAAEQAKPPIPKPEPPPVSGWDDDEPSGMVTISQAALEEKDQLIDEMIAESVAFEKILDADDKLSEAVNTIKMQQAEISALKSQLAGAQNKNNELIKLIKSKDRQISTLEKELQSYKIAELPV